MEELRNIGGGVQQEPLVGAGLSQLRRNNSRIEDLIERASQIAARVDGNGPSSFVTTRQEQGVAAVPTRPSRIGLHGAIEDAAEETSTLLDEMSNLLARIATIV